MGGRVEVSARDPRRRRKEILVSILRTRRRSAVVALGAPAISLTNCFEAAAWGTMMLNWATLDRIAEFHRPLQAR
jgi:hypothetical protein